MRAVPGILAANVTLIASYGAVAIAAAAAGVAIYEAIKAYMEWQNAVNQAKSAQNNANAQNEAAYRRGDITQAQYESNKAGIANDAYSTPWYMKSPASLLGFADGGTVKAQRGGVVVRVAEAGQDEDMVPASKRRSYAEGILGRSSPTFARGAFEGAIFVGTSRDAARHISDMVDRAGGRKLARVERG